MALTRRKLCVQKHGASHENGSEKPRPQAPSKWFFTCSWSDFFIEEADAWRAEAWRLIKECPDLIFQILTKRPQRIADHLPSDWGDGGYSNVALGVSVENNKYLPRIDILRTIPAPIHFVSAEPLLGSLQGMDLTHIEWMIVGGESGSNFQSYELGVGQRNPNLAINLTFLSFTNKHQACFLARTMFLMDAPMKPGQRNGM